MPIAPDCEQIARRPAGTRAPANVALRRTAGSVLSTPRQFGPTMRRPGGAHDLEQPLLARATLVAASAKPAERTSSAFAPCSAASRGDVEHLVRRARR